MSENQEMYGSINPVTVLNDSLQEELTQRQGQGQWQGRRRSLSSYNRRSIHQVCYDEFYVSEDYGTECMERKSDFELVELALVNGIPTDVQYCLHILRPVLVQIYIFRIHNHDIIYEEKICEIIVTVSENIYRNARAIYQENFIRLNNIRTMRAMKSLLNIDIKLDAKYRRSNHPPECPVCYEKVGVNTHSVTDCSHIFCVGCITKHMDTAKPDDNGKIACPMCRSNINEINVCTKINMKNLKRKCYVRNS